MDWTGRRESLRAIIKGDRCIHPASVYDGVSARIAGDLGFEAMMFAGSVASFTVLGAPDLCVLTLTEFAQQAYRINRAGSLPLLVDADHGYGNALSVKRTIEELETAGVSGLTIEDTLLPIAFGGDDKQLISIAEGVGKMKAAVAGRQDGVGWHGPCFGGKVADHLGTHQFSAVARADAQFGIGGFPHVLLPVDTAERVCLTSRPRRRRPKEGISAPV